MAPERSVHLLFRAHPLIDALCGRFARKTGATSIDMRSFLLETEIAILVNQSTSAALQMLARGDIDPARRLSEAAVRVGDKFHHALNHESARLSIPVPDLCAGLLGSGVVRHSAGLPLDRVVDIFSSRIDRKHADAIALGGAIAELDGALHASPRELLLATLDAWDKRRAVAAELSAVCAPGRAWSLDARRL